jgi:hypothetical protein
VYDTIGDAEQGYPSAYEKSEEPNPELTGS